MPVQTDVHGERLLGELLDFPALFEVSGVPCSEQAPRVRKNPQQWLTSTFGHPQRFLEWATGRLLALRLYKRGWLKISISHAGGWVFAGATREGGVGIDVEQASRQPSRRVMERFFSMSEQALPFSPLELWTLKEAGIKIVRHLFSSVDGSPLWRKVQIIGPREVRIEQSGEPLGILSQGKNLSCLEEKLPKTKIVRFFRCGAETWQDRGWQKAVVVWDEKHIF